MKSLLIISLLLVGVNCFCQNTVRFSQFNFVQSLYNPASIATDAKISADLVYRNQWYGVEGAPTTFAASGQYELDQDMAVGINFYNDQIGAVKTNSFMGQYAYRIPIDRIRYISFGLAAGMDNQVNDLANATLNQKDDPKFAESFSKTSFNASFGVFYKAPDFYAGVSIPQLYQTTLRQKRNEFHPLLWHIYTTTGFFVRRDNYTFNPHFQLKVVQDATLQGDVLIRNTWNNVFSLTLGYRSENALIGGFDIEVSQRFRVGYAFNYNLSLYTGVERMSNELYLGIGWPYHAGRYHFGERKFVSSKGNYRTDYHKRYRNKRRGRGQ